MISQRPTVLKPEFAPLSLARMLWKHWVIALVLALIGSAASFVIVQRLPAIYRSEALILIDSQKIPERYVSSTVNTELQDRLATISQEILSTTPLQKIIDTFGLYQKERKKLVQEEIIDLMRKDISIKIEKGWTRERPGAFHVGYQGPNPVLVTEVANQLANLFIEENLRTRKRQAEGTADFIDSQLGAAKKTLDELERKVSQYKLAHSGDLPEQENANNAALGHLQVELQGAQDAINRAQQNKIMLQGAMDMAEAAAGAVPSKRERAGRSPDTDARGNSPPKKESEFLQAQYDALRLRYEPNYPRMISLQHEIDKQKLAEDREAARIENLRTQILLADREIEQRNNERERVLKSIAQYQGRTEQLPVREQEMAALTRDYEMSKANYKSLLDKKLAAGMATDMENRQQAERFTMLDAARVPEKPVSPNRPLLEGIGCALSLALGLLFAVAKEIKKNAVLGEWELPEGLALLGRVPFIKPGLPQATQSGRDKPPRKWKPALFSARGRLGGLARLLSADAYLAYLAAVALSLVGIYAVSVYLDWGRH
jgi:succinoglycan biosynthesis transport protein ExoP